MAALAYCSVMRLLELQTEMSKQFHTWHTSHRAVACKTQTGLFFLPNIQEKYLKMTFCRKI